MKISSILSSNLRQVEAKSKSKSIWWIASNIQYKDNLRQRFYEHHFWELKAWKFKRKD